MKCLPAVLTVAMLAFLGSGGRPAADVPDDQDAKASPWGEAIEPDAPFVSSVLDARALGDGWPADNLTPRGLVLNLGHGLWACFDIDLLRVSAIWAGDGVTPVSMSVGSYHLAGAKAPEGQGTLPRLQGTPWLASGLYPGWQAGSAVTLTDPRPTDPDPRELGRGPLAPDLGRFRAIRLTADGPVLQYDVLGAAVEERIVARGAEGDHVAVERRFRVTGSTAPLQLLLGQRPASASPLHVTMSAGSSTTPIEPRAKDGLLVATVVPTQREFRVTMALDATLTAAAAAGSDQPPPSRWPQAVTTVGTPATTGGAFVVDRIALPLDNPWRRNVRLADIAFLGGGRAAAVTFDGDVWTLAGLDGHLTRVTWRRFASGLHEPLGLTARGGEIFVFDRNGIWRLVDSDGNGEADRHELFANGFVQTAETREFAMSIRTAPDGSFVIAKGGQEGTTVGRDNGSVLRVSADGRTVTRLGYGLRQPFASVDPKTGRVIASDQQGNYVPATPIFEIAGGRYHGFIPLILPKEQYPAPIAEPITWIPHSISASAAGQVWLAGARMGPLSDGLVLLNYYRPEALVVRLDDRHPRLQAAVVSLTRDLDFAPLAGAVNPADGQLYVAGFQIWGTDATAISGLARIRYTGAPTTLPRAIVPMDKGVLLRFEEPLDPREAVDPDNYSAERWDYRRTADYGSPHYRRDGQRGQEPMIPSSAYLSHDRTSVFVGMPDMRPVMQMRVGWSLRLAAGSPFQDSAYFTPHALAPFDPAAEGFDDVVVDLAPRSAPAITADATPATADAGQRIAARMGCTGCHSTDGAVVGRVGPTWKGLYGSQRTFADGGTAVADDDYLRQSILEPSAHIVRGFDQSDAGMPSYGGVLSAAEIDALVAYIRSLK